MARTPRWEIRPPEDGLVVVDLSSWKYFADFVNQELLDYRTYVFRGHASDRWKLESTLDRALKRLPTIERPLARRRHLEAFMYAVRGRRGSHPPRLESENDWWALGQHHGLSSPLLDWTESPFVALYFAFEAEDTAGSSHRSVWGISQGSISTATQEIEERDQEEAEQEESDILRAIRPRPPICEIFRPLTDENSRLVNQRGVFVRGPDGVPIESWIREHYAGDFKTWHLFKIRIPNKERTRCLRSLNRMNINHLSLFPDLFGAGRFCNMDLVIRNY